MALKVNIEKKAMAKLVQSKAGLTVLSAKMRQPLQEFRDHTSIVREIFQSDELSQGELPIYDKDVEAKAYTLDIHSATPVTVQDKTKIYVPTKDHATIVSEPMASIKTRGFNFNKRVEQKTRAEVFQEEDKEVFKFLSTLAQTEGNTIAATAANLSLDTISDAIGIIESKGEKIAGSIVINPTHLSLIRKASKDVFTPNSNEEIMRTGRLGVLYGCKVYSTAAMPADKILITSTPDTLGVFVDVVGVQALPYINTDTRQQGLSVFTNSGAYAFGSSTALITIA